MRAAFNIEGIEQDNFTRDLGRLMGDTVSLEATEAELMQDLLTRKILMTNDITV